MSDLTGQTVGAYQLVEKLGVGGMAEVYKAHQPSLDRFVALKFIRPELAEQEGFRPRFEREAKLLARLTHPSIVHVYDFGEADGRLYIVMEYVAGGTLRDRLRAAREAGTTLDLDTTLSLLDQMADALDHAHAQGVIHRDIKPANIMFTPDGRALLNDFGLAKLAGRVSDVSQLGGTSGTPDYMSPEQAAGDPAGVGPASDQYALGVVLYEIMTGRVPFTGETFVTVMLQHVNEDPPSPREFRPDLSEAAAQVMLKALAKEPSARFASVGEMVRAFRTALGLAVPGLIAEEPPAPGEPPFQGLHYFDEADADRFFGREALVEKLVGRLREDRFLAVVVGASGSGKSSIVRAGLVPALRRGGAYAAVHVLAPTAHPLEALAVPLTRESESVTAVTTLMDDMRRDARSLHLYVRKQLTLTPGPSPHQGEGGGGEDRLLLVVDQFEELFTLCHDAAERQAFVDNLMTAVAPETAGPTSVVVALRADFYAHCAQYAVLREAVARHQEFIGPMSTDELRRAIEEPARRGGWEIEPGLVDTLLEDVGNEPGALPLLSHALLETWKRRRGRTLTLRGYAESGGVRGAIAKTADEVYARLNPEQQAVARSIFLRLTELGEGTQDTRRRAALDELISGPRSQPLVESVLQTLTDARLVIVGEDAVEVAHEALIREWPALRAWLDENREGLRLHRQLTDDAREWLRLGRDPGALYRGVRLAQAREWAETHADEMNEMEREFLRESRVTAEQEEMQREAQRKRELESAKRLAEEAEARRKAEAARALEAEQSAARLASRNRIITGVSVALLFVALVACVSAAAAGVFGSIANNTANRNAALATQNAVIANTAQVGEATAKAGSTLAVAVANTAQAGQETAEAASTALVAEQQTQIAAFANAQATAAAIPIEWTAYELSEKGFAISLPPQWKYFDVTDPEALATGLDALRGVNAQAAANLEARINSVTTALRLDFIGVDLSPDALDRLAANSGIAMLYEVQETASQDLTLDFYVLSFLAQIESLYQPEELTHERVQTPSGEAERVQVRLELSLLTGETSSVTEVIYIFVEGRTAYVVFMITNSDLVEQYAPVFEEISRTFELLK
jgi:hypothetical protein